MQFPCITLQLFWQLHVVSFPLETTSTTIILVRMSVFTPLTKGKKEKKVNYPWQRCSRCSHSDVMVMCASAPHSSTAHRYFSVMEPVDDRVRERGWRTTVCPFSDLSDLPPPPPQFCDCTVQEISLRSLVDFSLELSLFRPWALKMNWDESMTVIMTDKGNMKYTWLW